MVGEVITGAETIVSSAELVPDMPSGFVTVMVLVEPMAADEPTEIDTLKLVEVSPVIAPAVMAGLEKFTVGGLTKLFPTIFRLRLEAPTGILTGEAEMTVGDDATVNAWIAKDPSGLVTVNEPVPAVALLATETTTEIEVDPEITAEILLIPEFEKLTWAKELKPVPVITTVCNNVPVPRVEGETLVIVTIDDSDEDDVPFRPSTTN